MEKSTVGTSRRRARTTIPNSLALAGNTLSISGTLKPGRNGSTGKLVVEKFGITIGDGHRHEPETPAPLPTGYGEIEVPDEVIANYHDAGDLVPVEGALAEQVSSFAPNTALSLIGRQSRKTALAVFKRAQNTLRIVQKPKEKRDKKAIQPVNTRQALALDLLLDPTIKLVTLYGKAGTGKTLMAILAALKATGKLPMSEFRRPIPLPSETETAKRIIVCRPICGVGGDDLGFLPGTLDEKMGPWGEAVMDALELFYEREAIEELQRLRLLNVGPVTHMRGRSVHDAFILVDDAQNFPGRNEKVMKTLVSRGSSGTKFVFTGDPNQVDTKGLSETDNGLVHVLTQTATWEFAARLELVKGERSVLADFAAENL